MELQTLTIIEIAIGWILVLGIIIPTLKIQRRLSNNKKVAHIKLHNGFRRQTIALGFSLIGLAELTTIAALYFPTTWGIIVFAINVPILYLTYQTNKEIGI